MESDTEQDVKNASHCDYRKWLALLGAMMIFFPTHLLYVWGNLSVYATSYVYAQYGHTSVASSWNLSGFGSGWNVGVFFSGYIGRVGRKTVVFLALLVFNMGIASLYFIVVKDATIVLSVVLGIIAFSCGLFESSVLKILSQTSDSSRGLFMSIASSGFNFGSFSINLFIGYYMNPRNLPPTVEVDGLSLFGDTETIDRLPSLFIIIAIAYPLLSFSGFFLLFLSTHVLAPKSDISPNYGTFSSENECALSTHTKRSCKEMSTKEENTNKSAHAMDLNSKRYTSISEEINSVENTVCTGGRADGENDESYGRQLTLRKMREHIPLYVICFSFGCGLLPTFLLKGHYKTFGLVHIKDDQFLTGLGSTIDFVAGATIIIQGFFLDKARNIKNCQVILYTGISLSLLVMYFAASVNKYFYFVATLFVAAGTFAYLKTLLMALLAYFGDDNLIKNLGWAAFSRILIGFIVPPLFDASRDPFGWFGPFLCSVFFTTTSLVMTVIFVPDATKRQ